MFNISNRFIKYIVVGISCYLFDLLMLFSLVEFLHVNYLVSTSIALICATYLNFSLNKSWSFNSSETDMAAFRKYLLLFGVNYLFTITTMHVCVQYLKFNYLFVKVIVILSISLWNFFLYKNYVYKAKSEKPL